MSSTKPMTPPSVMAVRWWILWMPNDRMAVPSRIIAIRLAVNRPSAPRIFCWSVCFGIVYLLTVIYPVYHMASSGRKQSP